jgi:SAM-dependent methyltransferase
VSAERNGGVERALTWAAPYLAVLVAAYAVLSVLLWLAGEVTGWLWTRRWPPTGAGDALGVLANVLRDPLQPSLAWPDAARRDLPPVLVLYALTMVLVTTVVVPAVRLALAYLVRGPRWADPNPRRAGFATSTALTTLSAASAQGGSLEPSYELWLGLERGPMGGLRALRGRGDRQTAGVVGPPGSGKTLGLILPGLLCWAGSAVATSTKTDVVLMAGAAREAIGRERGGGVHLLDWSGLVGPDLGLAGVCWDPLDGCRDTRVASSRVAALLGAVDGPHGRDASDGFWKEGAGTILRPYLHRRSWPRDKTRTMTGSASMASTTDHLDRRGRYGIDEPRWPALNIGVGAACLAGAALARRRSGRWGGWSLPAALGGIVFLGSAASYLHTSTRGKFAVWSELLRDLDLRGNETVLDMGCGRGAVLLMAARLLPDGRAVGIDLWRSAEQSGNRLEVTRRNAEREGVADRVELHTGDMRSMPFADGSADVVVSSVAIHNIADADGRLRALDEAVRVLRPGGRLTIADMRYVADGYGRHLEGRGMDDVRVRDLGWRFWYGGPWVATSAITARKPG